jgi:hypothetical protein
MKRWALGLIGLLAIGWIGWQDIPGEFLQRQRTFVTDFGAIPDDGLDDTDAIVACRRAAVANATYWVHFPAGTYNIEGTNVLHPTADGDGTFSGSAPASGWGIRFSGDAQNHSILKLSDESEVHWFYDSDGTPGWNRWQVEHLWFKGSGTTALTASSNTNGFRIWATTASGGIDKGLIVRNCRFDYLGVPIQYTGTSNAESCNYYSSWWNGCGPQIIENDQALALTYYSCHFYSAGDTIHVKATSGEGAAGFGGGGATAFRDCDSIRIDDGAAYNRALLVDQGRFEFRSTTYSRLLHWRGASSQMPSNAVVFTTCDFSPLHGADTYREYMSIGGSKCVIMRDCWLNQRWAMKFYDIANASVVGMNYQPLVLMDNCAIHEAFASDLPTRVEYDSGDTNPGSYGRVVSRSGRSLSVTGLDENLGFDFDYGNKRGGRGEPAAQRKRLYFMAPTQVWPTQSGGTGASERTVTLPANSRILAVGIDRPTLGSVAVTAIQYRIGSDDKTVTLCATGPVRGDGHHVAYADASTDPGIFPLNVGTDANLMRLRLWCGPTDSAISIIGGVAWVEYE